jgi:RNA polymerase sigma factor (sigma-70 family)
MHDHEHATDDSPELTGTPSPQIVATLVANHREFLAFVQRRVGNRAQAEEILQDAFVRSIDKLDTVRDTAVGWFYRVLRNAIIDHQRRGASAARRLDAYAAEQEEAAGTDEELHRVVCKCVGELADTLKPEYATALRRIEIDGVSVKDYADEAGITSSNAGVRIFRAREALRKQVARSCGTCADHGCFDCHCDTSAKHGCGHAEDEHDHGHGHGH